MRGREKRWRESESRGVGEGRKRRRVKGKRGDREEMERGVGETE